MALLDEVKIALRNTIIATDDEITSIIAACKINLTLAGADKLDDTDDLVKRAIILYAKANYGLANPDMDKYDSQYERLKILMSLCSAYQDGGV
jgi:hypothetical protein